MRIARRTAGLLSGLVLTFSNAAGATDLLQAWQAAQQNDPEFAAAQSAQEAGAARRKQADALWRPSVQLTAAAGRATSETSATGARFSAPGFGQSDGVSFDTSVTNGATHRWTLSARQPLLSRERQAQSRQLALAAETADLEWKHAQQNLMLRVAERYFDVVMATESLRVLRMQQASVDRALAEAKDRFQIGDVKVTDTHEASARAEAIRAQLLAAEADLQVKQAALFDLTGLPASSMPLPRPTKDVPAGDVPALDSVLAQARDNNPLVRMQAAGIDVAKEEAAKFSALASPTIDLVAQLGRERLSGSGDFGDASNRGNNGMIGVQLTIPLFTGGYRSARHEETLRLADKAQADASRVRQQVALQTRATWLNLNVGTGRIAALTEAWKASLARLDATRIGSQVGDRTTQDLLNAENDAANAELALLQGRIGLLLDRLRLAALAGQLDESALRVVNASLQGN
ncbi:MAG TPA: TolC family outer membrane protein [Noviherbaspirillum sp.]